MIHVTGDTLAGIDPAVLSSGQSKHVSSGVMLKIDSASAARIEAGRLSAHNERLSAWLSSRRVGWDDVPEPARAAFLVRSAKRAELWSIRTEQARCMLALAFLVSGLPEENLAARDDVREVVEDERVGEYGKVRRLHYIAFKLANGVDPAIDPDAAPAFETRPAKPALAVLA